MKSTEKKTGYKIIWPAAAVRLLFLIIAGLVLTAGFYCYKIYMFEKRVVQHETITNDNPQENSNDSTFISTAKSVLTSDYKELKGVDRGRINILLLGMGGEGHSGKYLTDTIILASINPKTYETALLSIPRDLYVEVPDSGIRTKINAVYAYAMRSNNNTSNAISEITATIRNITGQPVDYYVALDFEGFKKIIDKIDGIGVDVEQDIYDPRYPGPNYSYQLFEIDKGFHQMDGETALKYARVRHTEGGDFARAARQQKILAAAKRKAFSIETILNPIKINSLMNTLGDHLKTNVHLDEIPSFIHLAKNINIYQTTNKVLDAWSQNSLLAVSHVQLGGIRAFTLVPRTGNYREIHHLAENIFQIDYFEEAQKNIEEEKAEILILASGASSQWKIKSIFEKLGYKQTVFGSTEAYRKICQNNVEVYNNENSKEDPKLYTLNNLSEKFNTTANDVSFESETVDILVCLNEEKVDYFQSQIVDQNEIDEELKEQSVIDQEGNILHNKIK